MLTAAAGTIDRSVQNDHAHGQIALFGLCSQLLLPLPLLLLLLPTTVSVL
jgi:hypothetical protein